MNMKAARRKRHNVHYAHASRVLLERNLLKAAREETSECVGLSEFQSLIKPIRANDLRKFVLEYGIRILTPAP